MLNTACWVLIRFLGCTSGGSRHTQRAPESPSTPEPNGPVQAIGCRCWHCRLRFCLYAPSDAVRGPTPAKTCCGRRRQTVPPHMHVSLVSLYHIALVTVSHLFEEFGETHAAIRLQRGETAVSRFCHAQRGVVPSERVRVSRHHLYNYDQWK